MGRFAPRIWGNLRLIFITARKQRNTCKRLRRLAISSLLAAILCTTTSGRTFAHAGDPRGKDLADRPPLPSGVREICIAASDDGPCFTLADLRTYAPPPPGPRAWKIPPPVWGEYPVQLDRIPIVPRQYVSETASYLAAHEVRHGDPRSPYIALTFDCESGTHSTLQILETLEKKDVKATFFILGRYACRHPEMMREIAAGRHEFGNHSFFHPLFTDLSPITSTLEITYTEAAIDWAIGQHVPMHYFRFPYGRRNRATRMHVASMGYQSAFWDIDPRGWDPANSPEDVVEHVRHTAHPGGIVIMHCGSWNDANALADVIRVIRDKGFIPGTLSDVLSEADRNVLGYSPP